MHPKLALAAPAALAFLGLWFALTVVTAPAPSHTPDAASRHAVRELVAGSPSQAAAAVPGTFTELLGYTPRIEDDALVNPTGDCSSPVPLPAEFATACRSHDLGYDLVRHADLRGGTLPPSARRQIDARFSREAHAACADRTATASRTHCRMWADIATGAVRLNSWRQHDLVPKPEDAASIATGATGLLALGSGGSTLALGAQSLRRRLGALRLPAVPVPAVPLPRVSTALAAVLGVFLSISPASLPHGPLLQGGVTAVFIGACLGVVALVRPRSPRWVGPGRSRGVAAAVGLGVVVLMWGQLGLAARRTEIGLTAPGAGYWLGVGAVVLGCGLLVRGARWMWQRRERVRRPLVAMTTATVVLASTGPVYASDPTPDESLLLETSPVGAVRAYGEIAEDEGVRDRAERVVDELELEGGLRRSRIVVAVPTGTGWINPNLVTGLEQRFGSDVATAGMQYGTSPSWVAYLVGRDQAQEGAQALVDAVVRRVQALPAADRPDVHITGESLGATAGQSIFTGPGSGAAREAVCSVLWVGPPGGHRAGLARESAVVNEDDPVVHASAREVVLPPEDGRGWLPVVSAAHDAADFLGALAVPEGTGHVYGPDLVDHLQTCP
ncbi:MAG: alpha/beta-hydrolase family protein [Janibacter sp.]